MNRPRYQRFLPGIAVAVLSLLPLLIVASVQLPALYGFRSRVKGLRLGMSIDAVQKQMGGKPAVYCQTANELNAALPQLGVSPLPQPAKMRGPLLVYAFKNEGSDYAYLYFDSSHRLVEITAPWLHDAFPR